MDPFEHKTFVLFASASKLGARLRLAFIKRELLITLTSNQLHPATFRETNKMYLKIFVDTETIEEEDSMQLGINSICLLHDHIFCYR